MIETTTKPVEPGAPVNTDQAAADPSNLPEGDKLHGRLEHLPEKLDPETALELARELYERGELSAELIDNGLITKEQYNQLADAAVRADLPTPFHPCPEMAVMLDREFSFVRLTNNRDVLFPDDPAFSQDWIDKIIAHVEQSGHQSVWFVDTAVTEGMYRLTQELLSRGVEVHIRDHHLAPGARGNKFADWIEALNVNGNRADIVDVTRAEAPACTALVRWGEAGPDQANTLIIAAPFDFDAAATAMKLVSGQAPKDSRMDVINRKLQEKFGADFPAISSPLEWAAMWHDSSSVRNRSGDLQVPQLKEIAQSPEMKVTQMFDFHVKCTHSVNVQTLYAATLAYPERESMGAAVAFAALLQHPSSFAGIMQSVQETPGYSDVQAVVRDRDRKISSLVANPGTQFTGPASLRVFNAAALKVEGMDPATFFHGETKALVKSLKSRPFGPDEIPIVQTEFPGNDRVPAGKAFMLVQGKGLAGHPGFLARLTALDQGRAEGSCFSRAFAGTLLFPASKAKEVVELIRKAAEPESDRIEQALGRRRGG